MKTSETCISCELINTPNCPYYEEEEKYNIVSCGNFLPKKMGKDERNETLGSSHVSHPEHYNRNPEGIECIQVVQHLNFNLGNAVKYIWRAFYKGKYVEDLKKAIKYLEFEIDRYERFDR